MIYYRRQNEQKQTKKIECVYDCTEIESSHDEIISVVLTMTFDPIKSSLVPCIRCKSMNALMLERANAINESKYKTQRTRMTCEYFTAHIIAN